MELTGFVMTIDFGSLQVDQMNTNAVTTASQIANHLDMHGIRMH